MHCRPDSASRPPQRIGPTPAPFGRPQVIGVRHRTQRSAPAKKNERRNEAITRLDRPVINRCRTVAASISVQESERRWSGNRRARCSNLQHCVHRHCRQFRLGPLSQQTEKLFDNLAPCHRINRPLGGRSLRHRSALRAIVRSYFGHMRHHVECRSTVDLSIVLPLSCLPFQPTRPPRQLPERPPPPAPAFGWRRRYLHRHRTRFESSPPDCRHRATPAPPQPAPQDRRRQPPRAGRLLGHRQRLSHHAAPPFRGRGHRRGHAISAEIVRLEARHRRRPHGRTHPRPADIERPTQAGRQPTPQPAQIQPARPRAVKFARMAPAKSTN